ncbi:ATPase [Chitinophaga caeni]|uniref:histidine kinase n=1 Tax=Chitinophaga caeni TaxID=2029983 RepID=A0A291QT83_9BACT|nr:7TM diverse intracellular signaling domain-containing protein [Chitinophaga caeni]ATL47156.1 ATPase [Chitinophaga caeni]
MFIRSLILSGFILLMTLGASASGPIIYRDGSNLMKIGEFLQLYVDKEGKMTIHDIENAKFSPSTQQVPNLGISPYTSWAKFTINNLSNNTKLLIEVEYPTIDEITLYQKDSLGRYITTRLGEYKSFYHRPYNHQNYIFPVMIAPGSSQDFFLKIKAGEQAQLPIFLGTETQVNAKNDQRNFIFGIYAGIIIVMVLYNFFIAITTRDRTYLIYVSYIIFVGLTQASQNGYTFRFLYPNNTWLALHDTVIIPIMNGITAALFIQSFLHTKERYRTGHRILNIVIIAYALCFIPTLLDNYFVAQIWVQLVAMSGSLLAIFVSYKISRTGYTPALYFLVAWGIFLSSVCIFVLRNFNVLPYNDFTYYALQIGSAAEVTLLSFALANKINIYRKEKEESQATALMVSQENERLVREQNAVLEAKVQERTEELQNSNKELNKTLVSLKEAQTQLVESEKMASLGQLTAGIAHEINNPINFVTSNIKPLKLDFADLKSLLHKYDNLNPSQGLQEQLTEINAFKKEIDIDYVHEEIDTLIRGIEDGASRTAEIVKGLRTFSRLDESDLKSVDLHEGINSTLVLLRNNIPGNVEIIRNYGDLPKVECYAGKMNQVFLNIINNAVNAIKSKPEQGNHESVTITTQQVDDQTVRIGIKDTGTGMTEKVKEKIFEPFFTTKDVGEGTGLGLSIVFSIIEKHHGRILVESAPGEGAEFIIYLPINITNHTSQ